MASTYYEEVGVKRTASPGEIRRAWARLAKKYHPDLSSDADAHERMKRLNEAYEVLKDPGRRTAYDRELAAAEASRQGSGYTRPTATPPTASRRQHRSARETFDLGRTAFGVWRIPGWLGLSLVVSSIVGYVVGFRAAQPVFNMFVGLIGAIVVTVIVGVITLFIVRHVPWGLLWYLLRWLVERKKASRESSGTSRRTLIWIGAAIVGGSLTGGALGYVIGLETAQPFFDMLAGIGTIVVIVAVAALVVCAGVAAYARSGGRR